MCQIWCLFEARKDICRDTEPRERLRGTNTVPKKGLGGSGRLPGRKITFLRGPQNSNLGEKSSLLDVPKMDPVLQACRRGGSGAKIWIPYRKGFKNQGAPGRQKGFQKGLFSGPCRMQNLNFSGPGEPAKTCSVSGSRQETRQEAKATMEERRLPLCLPDAVPI